MTTMSSTPNSNDTLILGPASCDTININPSALTGINTGSIYTLSANGSGAWSNPQPTISNFNGSNTISSGTDLVIKDKKGKEVSVLDMNDRIKIIEERLLVINDIEKHKKYPALKNAYEQYKLIDALCQPEITTKGKQ